MTAARPPARLLVGLWLLLAAAQGVRVAVTGSAMSGDGVYYFAHLHSFVLDRDFDPVNEIRHFERDVRSPYTGRPKLGNRTTRNPATGEVVNKSPIGLALLVLPAYVVLHVLALAIQALGAPLDTSGYGWPYQYASALAVAAYAVIGLWCCQRVAVRAAGASAADGWRATLLVAGATPWLFYATLEPLFAHALSATAAAVVVLLWLRAREHDAARAWLLVGLAGGIGATIRYQDAVLLLAPALDLLLRAGVRPRRTAAAGLVLAAGTLAGAAPQLVANAVVYGHPLATGYFGEGFTHWQAPRLLYTLASPAVGLLRWAPITIPAIAGLVVAGVRGSAAARAGLLTLAVQIYIVSSWYFVSQGHSFGNRMLLNCTVFFVLGLAAALSYAGPWWHRGLVATGVALVLVNLVLVALWSVGAIGPLSW